MHRGFEQLCSSIGWRDMACYGIKKFGQKSDRYGPERVLNGVRILVKCDVGKLKGPKGLA